MNLDRNTREELNALSKEVYGTSSRWKKFLERGYTELLTEEVTETVTDKDGKTEEKKVKKPIRRKDGALQSVTKHHTVESIKQVMLDRREQIKQINELKRQIEEKKKQEELNKQVQEDAGGSAV